MQVPQFSNQSATNRAFKGADTIDNHFELIDKQIDFGPSVFPNPVPRAEKTAPLLELNPLPRAPERAQNFLSCKPHRLKH